MKAADQSYRLAIPDNAGHIIETLNRHGYEAYLVGGCVRDSVLGLIPQDWDIATNASPLEVKGLFGKTVDTGIQHGTVTVVIGTGKYEVTTYRIEGDYVDNRRPSEVRFTSSLGDDLRRRDFTVNALAYHPAEGLVDLFNGLNDLRKKVIRTVGEPDERFQEDALRMLRAVRLSAQLGFTIEVSTLLSIRANSRLLRNISRERIRDEVTKILLSPHPERFVLIYDLGMFDCVFPCIETEYPAIGHDYTDLRSLLKLRLKVVSRIEPDKVLRWAALLHGALSPLAGKLLEALRFDKKTADRVCRLVSNNGANIRPNEISIRKSVYFLGDDIFNDLLKLLKAAAKNVIPGIQVQKPDRLNRIKGIYLDIKRKSHCLSIKDLAVNGHDLEKLGYSRGKEIGEVLEMLMEKVLENPAMNNREELMKQASILLYTRCMKKNVEK